MTDFTDYLEGQIVNWMVSGSDMPASHSNIYVALHTSDPTNSGENNEVSASSYARVSTTAGTDWSVSGNTFSNLIDIEFPEAQEDWGNITHFTLWDGPDATDNALAWSALDRSRDVSTGDAPVFRDGTLNGSVN
jgi:hypothetical protein